MVREGTSPGSGASARLPGHPVAVEQTTITPITVAGPRRILTGFRMPPSRLNSLIGDQRAARLNLLRSTFTRQLDCQFVLQFGSAALEVSALSRGYAITLRFKLLVQSGDLGR